MTQSIITVIIFIVLLAMLPSLIKWLQQKHGKIIEVAEGGIKIISALAVGPQQRILTVEVGPPTARVWLVVGVTAQKMECLYTLPGPTSNAIQSHSSDSGMISHAPSSVHHD